MGAGAPGTRWAHAGLSRSQASNTGRGRGTRPSELAPPPQAPHRPPATGARPGDFSERGQRSSALPNHTQKTLLIFFYLFIYEILLWAKNKKVCAALLKLRDASRASRLPPWTLPGCGEARAGRGEWG